MVLINWKRMDLRFMVVWMGKSHFYSWNFIHTVLSRPLTDFQGKCYGYMLQPPTMILRWLLDTTYSVLLNMVNFKTAQCHNNPNAIHYYYREPQDCTNRQRHGEQQDCISSTIFETKWPWSSSWHCKLSVWQICEQSGVMLIIMITCNLQLFATLVS